MLLLAVRAKYLLSHKVKHSTQGLSSELINIVAKNRRLFLSAVSKKVFKCCFVLGEHEKLKA
jgi:hypothetical protein